MSMVMQRPSESRRRDSLWARVGFAGFLFFLFKGLVWLALAAAVGLGW